MSLGGREKETELALSAGFLQGHKSHPGSLVTSPKPQLQVPSHRGLELYGAGGGGGDTFSPQHADKETNPSTVVLELLAHIIDKKTQKA